MSVSREKKITLLEQGDKKWDMIVIGGGITGAGIAREAARRGLDVLLVERQDFSWGTSSRSSKMVHGGLRYIASGDFKTTMDSVRERERLLSEVPGLVDLMPYMMLHYKGQFPPPFLFNLLLSIYDFFAKKHYHRFFAKKEAIFLSPLIEKKNLKGGTQFADAVTDDSRLVLRVLQQAQKEGCVAINYVSANSMIVENDKVVGLNLYDEISHKEYSQKASVVVNATGTFVDELRNTFTPEKKIRPARGSHLVVPFWCLPVSQAYTCIHPQDKRPVFIFPWEGRTVIGTTDIEEKDIQNKETSITQDEFDYLLGMAQSQFPHADIQASDVISTWAGVRPLIASGASSSSKEKRDHSVWDDKGLISVSGGKLTTFRLIALDVLAKSQKHCNKIEMGTQKEPMFGDDTDSQAKTYTHLKPRYQKRLSGFYGDKLPALMAQTDASDLVEIPGTHTLWAQLTWACTDEDVVNLDDLLLRRVRIGGLLEQGGKAHEGRIKHICQTHLGWDEAIWQQQWQRYQTIWSTYYGLPSKVDDSQ